MNNVPDSTQTPTSDSESAGVVRASPEQQQVISDLKPEIDQWQAKIDAAKLQMHLGAKEARETLRPHVERLEQELGRVNAAWGPLLTQSGQ